MPILNVKVSGNRSANLTRQINELLLDITSRILKKKRELTAIVIDYIHHDDWSIGSITLKELNKNSFYLSIKITDETNTKDEKTEYIQAIFSGFENLLKNLHEESYIHIEDARADAYGFGGKTQEYRYHHK